MSMTRKEFLAKTRDLLDEIEESHEESTGISDTETQDWDEWLSDLNAAFVNS